MGPTHLYNTIIKIEVHSVNARAIHCIIPLKNCRGHQHVRKEASRPLTLCGAAARGALTFFRLSRDDNGIAWNIVWGNKTSGQRPARPLTLRGMAAHGALTFSMNSQKYEITR